MCARIHEHDDIRPYMLLTVRTRNVDLMMIIVIISFILSTRIRLDLLCDTRTCGEALSYSVVDLIVSSDHFRMQKALEVIGWLVMSVTKRLVP